MLFCSQPVVSKHQKRGLKEDIVVVFIETQSVTQPKYTEEATQGRASANLDRDLSPDQVKNGSKQGL